MAEQQPQPQEAISSEDRALRKDVIQESWWHLPILNSFVAAYQCGRLLNQFRWDAEQAWLPRSDTHFQHSMTILAKLAAVPCEVAGCNTGEITAGIRELEDKWRDTYSCEEAYEAIEHLVHPDDFPDSIGRGFSTEHEYLSLLRGWVKPIVGRLHQLFAEEFPKGGSGYLDLGYCVDEGVRREDVYRFMYRLPRPIGFGGANDEETDFTPGGQPEIAEEHDDGKELPRGGTHGRSPSLLPKYSPRPSELPPETSWTHRLMALCKRVGIGLDRSDLAKLTVAESGKPLREFVADIDHKIRQGLEQLSHSEDAPLVLPHLELSFDATGELHRKGLRVSVSVTAPLRQKLLRVLMRAGEGHCAREQLHLVWPDAGRPTPKSRARLDTEISRLKKQLRVLQISVDHAPDRGYQLADLNPPARDSITTTSTT